jgi:hypothetical protein
MGMASGAGTTPPPAGMAKTPTTAMAGLPTTVAYAAKEERRRVTPSAGSSTSTPNA